MVSGMVQRYRRTGPSKPARVALTALLAAGSASCAADEPAAPARLKACDVLPRSVVEGIIGGPLDEPASAEGATDSLAGRSGCAWSRSDDERAVLVELVRTADMAASVRRTGFSASARFAGARTEFPDAEPVDLGDRAIYVEEEATLHVLVDGSYLTVEVAAQPPSSIPDLATDLGRAAVDRLRGAGKAD